LKSFFESKEAMSCNCSISVIFLKNEGAETAPNRRSFSEEAFDRFLERAYGLKLLHL